MGGEGERRDLTAGVGSGGFTCIYTNWKRKSGKEEGRRRGEGDTQKRAKSP